MDSVTSKIQETGQHAAKRTDAIFTRTREAGEALIDEVRGVGDEVAAFVSAETKGWKRFRSGGESDSHCLATSTSVAEYQ